MEMENLRHYKHRHFAAGHEVWVLLLIETYEKCQLFITYSHLDYSHTENKVL